MQLQSIIIVWCGLIYVTSAGLQYTSTRNENVGNDQLNGNVLMTIAISVCAATCAVLLIVVSFLISFHRKKKLELRKKQIELDTIALKLQQIKMNTQNSKLKPKTKNLKVKPLDPTSKSNHSIIVNGIDFNINENTAPNVDVKNDKQIEGERDRFDSEQLYNYNHPKTTNDNSHDSDTGMIVQIHDEKNNHNVVLEKETETTTEIVYENDVVASGVNIETAM